MSGKKENFSRRDFIKTAGAAGLGSVLMPLSSLTQAHGSSSTKAPEQMIIPRRPFGKTGVDACVKAGIGLTAMKTQAGFLNLKIVVFTSTYLKF